MANNKANSAEVLKYFNDRKQAEKGAIIKSYNEGGFTDQLCTGWNGKRGCKKTFRSKGKSKTYNPRSGNGLNIGGNGKVKRAFKRFGKKIKRAVRNIG